MANDDETLTFRLRAVAENMSAFSKAARGADDVNASMIKSKKVSEDLAKSSAKLTAARDKESDASGRVRAAEAKVSEVRDRAATAAGRVRIAETNLNTVRGNSNAKMTQIVTAEERLAAARRYERAVTAQIGTAEDRLAAARTKSARATGDANRIEADFRKVATQALAKIAQDSGESSGRRFSIGFRKSSNDGSIENDATRKSSTLGRIFGGGGEDAGHRFSIGFGRKTNDGSIENDVNRRSKLLSALFGSAGANSGHRFSIGFGKGKGNVGKDIEKDLAAVAGDAEKGASLIGRTFGTGILSGLEGAIKTPAGPYIFTALVVAATIAGPAIGAVLAGGIIFAFGAGLATLGIIFAAKSKAVKDKWSATTKAMSADLQGIAAPFQGVLIHMADSMRTTLGQFAPILKSIFATSAGPVQRFVDDVLGALGKLKPALAPLSSAFNALLASLGPGLQGMFKSIADGLTSISNSVARNPNGLADFVRGIGTLTKELLDIIGTLNDANGAFERLTGGTSAVTVLMDALAIAVGIVLTPFLLLASYVKFVGKVFQILGHGLGASGKSMEDAANKTIALAQGLKQTGDAAHGAAAAHAAHAATLAHSNTVTHAANLEAYNLAHAFEREAAATQHSIDLLNRRADLLLSLSGSEIDYAQAVADATAAVKANGHTHNLATQAGRDNKRALDQVAASAKNMRDNLLKANDGNVKAAQAAQVGRAAYIKLAIQMGYTSKQAQKMAADLIKIPNVSRTAVLLANKKDLDAKLKNVNKQLNDKNLTKARIAQLQGNKKDIEAKLKVVLRALGDPKLVQARIAQLQGNKKDLDAKLKNVLKQLRDPNLTKARIAQLQANKKDIDKKIAAAQAELNSLHPKKVPPKLNADPLLLQRKVAAAQRQIDHMHGKVVPITYTFNGTNFTLGTGPHASQRGKGAIATGGKISGPGSGTSDRAGLFALSNKEWVIKAQSSQGYGDKAMASINDGTATVIPGLARGGRARGRGTAPIDIHGTGVFRDQAQLRAILGDSLFGGASSTAGIGKGVARWRGVALSALAAAHEPLSWIGSLLRRMNQESGGNPRAINLSDSNFRAGDPSRGLMQCVPLDSEILTRRGWLRHDQVLVGDETIGYNPATGRSEWTRISKVVHYEDAPITRIGNKHWHARTTPNHRWWSDTGHLVRPGVEVCPECGWKPRGKKAPARGVQVHRNKMHGIAQASSRVAYRGEFVRTENLTYGHRLRLAAPADTSGIPTLSLTDVRILAWLQGDGTLREAENGRGWDGVIWQSKPAQIVKLCALLVGIEHTEAVRPRRAEHHLEPHVFRLRRAFVTDLIKRSELMEMGPEAFVLALSPDQRAAWLDSMIDAEGHRMSGKKPSNREFVRIAQIDGDLQDAITLAVYLEGYRPTFSANSAERNGYQPAGVVGMTQPHVVPSMFDGPEYLAERETVWCVKTDLETWTMRQDGQVMLTGNTIGSTFNAYAGPYRSRGIYDPFANIYAAIKYTVARYGSGPAGWNRAGGYKNGGWLMPGQTAFNETRRPEAVFNERQLARLGTGLTTVRLHDDDRRMQRKLLAAVERLADRPVQLDGDRVDAHFSSKAVGRGY